MEAVGHRFTSDTDTEVIAHLLEAHTVEEVQEKLEGFYSFVAMKDGELIVTKQGMPLHERVIDGDLYISSDPAAFPPYADGDGKNGYVHHMLKEIYDQAVRPVVGQRLPEADSYVFVGCGSSYHAALYGAILAKQAGFPAEAAIASECDIVGHLVVGITQSGETYDVLQALRIAQGTSVDIAVITNTPGSSAANPDLRDDSHERRHRDRGRFHQDIHCDAGDHAGELWLVPAEGVRH